MRRRPHYPQVRDLDDDEVAAVASCLRAHWPDRTPTRVHVEGNYWVIVDWPSDSGPVIEQRLRLDHLAEHLVERVPTNYRQDRTGEQWHIVPDNEHGLRGRTLCGAPRQGSRLSEAHAQSAPLPPELLCQRCAELLDSVTTTVAKDVLPAAAM